MQIRILALIFAIGMAGNSALAAGGYVGGQVGLSIVADSSIDDGSGIPQEATFSPGFSIVGSAGYATSANVRVEGELGYLRNNADQFKIAGLSFGADGSASVFSAMLNVFYDIPVGDWVPYVGGGIGVARVSINDFKVLGIPLADDSDTVFAWQVGGGVGYKIDPAWTVVLDYRYFSTTDPDFVDLGGAPFSAEIDIHMIRVGTIYRF